MDIEQALSMNCTWTKLELDLGDCSSLLMVVAVMPLITLPPERTQLNLKSCVLPIFLQEPLKHF